MPSLVAASAAVAMSAVIVPAVAAVSPSPYLTVVVGILVLAGAGMLLLARSLHFLGKEEQLRVELFTETIVMNGPGIKFLNPFGYRKATKQLAKMLGTTDYLKIKDTVKGGERVERGPQLLFLGAYESIMEQGQGLTLSQTQYLFVENKLTGESDVVRGPTIWFPADAQQSPSSIKTAVPLQEDEYVRLKDEATGQRWIEKGKTLLFLQPRWKMEGGVRRAWTLKSYEYVRLLNTVTGKVQVKRGEAMIFPGPDEELVDSDKQKAVQVDEEHAVLVRDTSTGQLHLTTEKQLFVPGPHEKIEEVQTLINLSDNEAIIIKDKDGNLHFHYGNPKKETPDAPRSFFLQPYSEIVKLWWSSGLRRLRRDLCIERFDCRAQYMWFEFDCRTSDNVELILETTMFWEVVSLEQMVRSTGNLPGDIFNQARSRFIKHVAQVTLKGFMEQLHSISKTIHAEDSEFYSSRGVKIHSMEVTRYSCAEARTSEVLQQIIEETTNRLNRLSQAESENEVKLFKMQGQIEQEKLNEELLAIQQKHSETDARAGGKAEAERVAAFMEGLSQSVPKLEDRIAMWQTLRKTDALSVVSEGKANLYYTPNDVDLSIRTESSKQ
eukprot:TRINITY_DN19066_c0_g1_i2.p1 TRINITY_DN19066_c0_g1~~TRINITY_DN19066_c0_g1_i2.p1  ORF type:complete len:607 (-),score=124.24 TRINITY_DN19066_c0_g1_i2:213-2033(-)